MNIYKDNPIVLCISGAADTGHCGVDSREKGIDLGKEIGKRGAVLVTGATTGFPLWGAMGAKSEGGISIGLSPASNLEEHKKVYKLPSEYMDLIVYTGFGYPGRDLLLVRSAEAVLIGCGRIGTIHEFTIAFEDNKPIGVLQGDWATDEVIQNILANGNRPNAKIVFDTDPARLVEKVIELVRIDRLASGNN